MKMDPPRLSREAFWFCLGVSLALFAIIDNPLLGNPFDITGSIVWSYLAIPPLVAAALVIQRKWDLRSLALESALMVTIKFAITYALAAVLWMVAGEPPEPKAPTKTRVMKKIHRAYSISRDVPDGVVTITATAELAPDLVLSVGDTIAIAPPDDRLHTAFATRPNGSLLFNVPMPAGHAQAITFHEPFERITLRCTVHGSAEHYPTLVVER